MPDVNEDSELPSTTAAAAENHDAFLVRQRYKRLRYMSTGAQNQPVEGCPSYEPRLPLCLGM